MTGWLIAALVAYLTLGGAIVFLEERDEQTPKKPS